MTDSVAVHIGWTVGQLEVTALHADPSTPSKRRWRCRCNCGETVVRNEKDLKHAARNGVKPSCKRCHAFRTRPRYAVGRES